ncbi:MAG: hypothetical protein AAGE94_09710 [Acidobacteriota bacterium]
MKKTLTLLAAALLLCSAAFAAERTETKPAAETVSVFVLDGEGNLQLTEGAVAIGACQVDADNTRFTEPVFLIDDDGALKLTDAATTADGDIEVRKCFSGPCNGGTCETAGGTVLTCPTTGGPSCSSSEECSCSCAGGTARNVCT